MKPEEKTRLIESIALMLEYSHHMTPEDAYMAAAYTARFVERMEQPAPQMVQGEAVARNWQELN